MPHIQIIDDRKDIRTSLAFLLQDKGYQTLEADSPLSAQQQIEQTKPDLILLDMNFQQDTTSGDEGISFLCWLQHKQLDIPVIAMTAWGNTQLVVKAMNLGAKDFIEKPWNNHQLLNAIGQQLELSATRYENAKLNQRIGDTAQEKYQWRSENMIRLEQQLATVAQTDANILLTGENGVGKSEFAQIIHQHAGLPLQNLIQVNIGAIPEALFESEMFGHVKGAFTDAKRNRIGRFELANNGTLFLDEIGTLTLSNQAKLLRVLENGEYEQVGSDKTLHSNARIVAATNADLNQAIAQGDFRQDLYYRLNTVNFNIPRLKERELDVIPFAEFSLQRACQRYNKAPIQIEPKAQQALQQYGWPGNVRELSHLMERCALLNTTGFITLDELQLPNQLHSDQPMPLMPLLDAEVALLKRALKECDNNVIAAGEILGLTKSAMYRRLEKHQISNE